MKSLDKNKTNKAEWEKYKVKGDWRVNGFVFDHYVIPECELPHLLSSERQRLEDEYEKVFSEVSKVYCEITDGRLSKPGYKAEDVLTVYEDCVNDLVWKAEAEARQETLTDIKKYIEENDGGDGLSQTDEWLGYIDKKLSAIRKDGK